MSNGQTLTCTFFCLFTFTGFEKSIGPPYGFNSTNVTYLIFSRRFFAIFFVLPQNKPFKSMWVWPYVPMYIITTQKQQQWAYLRENFDEFWSKEKWPPSSPDANPMDFSVQSILETKVCKKNYSSVKVLTKSLQQEWKKISVDEIRKICAAAPNRLKAIAEKEGHHVE